MPSTFLGTNKVNAFGNKHMTQKKIGRYLSDDLGLAKESDGMLNPSEHSLQNHIKYSKVDGYKGFNTKKGKSLLGF